MVADRFPTFEFPSVKSYTMNKINAAIHLFATKKSTAGEKREMKGFRVKHLPIRIQVEFLAFFQKLILDGNDALMDLDGIEEEMEGVDNHEIAGEVNDIVDFKIEVDSVTVMAVDVASDISILVDEMEVPGSDLIAGTETIPKVIFSQDTQAVQMVAVAAHSKKLIAQDLRNSETIVDEVFVEKVQDEDLVEEMQKTSKQKDHILHSNSYDDAFEEPTIAEVAEVIFITEVKEDTPRSDAIVKEVIESPDIDTDDTISVHNVVDVSVCKSLPNLDEFTRSVEDSEDPHLVKVSEESPWDLLVECSNVLAGQRQI